MARFAEGDDIWIEPLTPATVVAVTPSWLIVAVGLIRNVERVNPLQVHTMTDAERERWHAVRDLM